MKKRRRYFLNILTGLLTGFFNGLFGSGGGTIAVLFMDNYMKIEKKEAHATAIVIILSFTLVSLIFYGMNLSLNYKVATNISIGGIIGGYLGGKTLPKLSNEIIRKIFGAFMIIASVKLVMN